MGDNHWHDWGWFSDRPLSEQLVDDETDQQLEQLDSRDNKSKAHSRTRQDQASTPPTRAYLVTTAIRMKYRAGLPQTNVALMLLTTPPGVTCTALGVDCPDSV